MTHLDLSIHPSLAVKSSILTQTFSARRPRPRSLVATILSLSWSWWWLQLLVMVSNLSLMAKVLYAQQGTTSTAIRRLIWALKQLTHERLHQLNWMRCMVGHKASQTVCSDTWDWIADYIVFHLNWAKTWVHLKKENYICLWFML